MIDVLRLIFTPGNFEPHSVHFASTPGLLWTLIVVNVLIAVAYLILPAQLFYIYVKRRDFDFSWVFIVIAFFGVWCSLTHIMNAVVFFYPVYWLEGIINVITGVVSFAAFIAYIVATPLILKLANPAELNEKTKNLSTEVEHRTRAVAELKTLNENLLRTNKEIFERGKEVEEINKQSVARELKMVELKKIIEEAKLKG